MKLINYQHCTEETIYALLRVETRVRLLDQLRKLADMIEDDYTGPYLPPGTKVRLNAKTSNQDGDFIERDPEFGIVVHCWLSEEIGMYDCYITFFGNSFPSGQPTEQPYTLRYASKILTILKE